MKQFKAPWGIWLWVMSVLVTLLCLVLAADPRSGWWRVLPLLFIAVATLFTVRGYEVAPDCIRVRRLFWTTRLPLAGLQSARVPLDAERRGLTLRVWGNGGFFSFTGWHWCKALGFYRAFVTDPKRVVVLRFARRTAVVLSPDSPEDLIRELSLHINQA